MSEIVHYKGKLRLVTSTKNNDFFETICQGVLAQNGQKDRYSYYDSWSEQIQGELYNEYIVIEKDNNYSLYEVLSRKSIDEYEMFNIVQIADNEYEYEVMYYNGGMGLSEAIEESFKRLGE